MRKFSGLLCLLAGFGFTYSFATFGTGPGAEGPWGPFQSLGRHYPGDAGLLIAAAWLAGLGLYLMLHEPVGPGGKFTSDGRFLPAPTGYFNVTGLFLLNALAAMTVLFATAVGVYGRHDGPLVPILASAAAVQVACGLVLMIMAFFDRPRSSGRLTIGTAAYVLSAVATLAVLLMGKPD